MRQPDEARELGLERRDVRAEDESCGLHHAGERPLHVGFDRAVLRPQIDKGDYFRQRA